MTKSQIDHITHLVRILRMRERNLMVAQHNHHSRQQIAMKARELSRAEAALQEYLGSLAA